MTLEIDGIRPRVLRDEVHLGLCEIMKFRHFSRYYFELDYDWDKLVYLLKKFNDVRVPVREDLAAFERYVEELLT